MDPIIILIIILIAVLVAYGVILQVKNRQAKTIEQLDIQKRAVFEIPVDSVLLKLRQMHLTGKTKNLYENWYAQWETMQKEALPSIEEKLDQAEQLADQMRFFQANSLIEEAKTMINDSEKLAFQTDEALQRIVDSETDNHNEIEAVNQQYKDLRNDIIANKTYYQTAFESIETRLETIESSIEQFNTLMEEADYIEARDVLKNVEKQTLELENIVTEIPGVFKQLESTIREDIDDLKQGHSKMVAENFQFADVDVPFAIDEIENRVQHATRLVDELAIEDAKEEIAAIQSEIERLYTVMESEIDAKEYVIKHQKRLETLFETLQVDNQKLLQEVDRLSQHYELTDSEKERLEAASDTMNTQKEAFEHYAISQGNNTVLPYTTVQKHFKEIGEQLNTLTNQQAELSQALSQLRTREQDVREQLEMFELDLRNMKRTVEKQYLPGLPQAYLDLFFATTQRVEELSEKLNRVVINMKEIDEYVALCVEDIEQLDEKTEAIVDDAAMTERLIQYANRYKMEYAAIDKAILKASNLYQHQYKYDEAKQAIALELDKVERNASARVARIYQDDKKNIFY